MSKQLEALVQCVNSAFGFGHGVETVRVRPEGERKLTKKEKKALKKAKYNKD